MNSSDNMDEEEAKQELQKGFNQAEEILEDQDKLEDFLRKLEAKLREIPVAGKQGKYGIINSLKHKKGKLLLKE